jgi:ankyrin repeat protein
MKSLRIALVIGAFALFATPALAQFEGPDSSQFLDAVQKRDGDKATQLLTDHPTVINSRDSKGDTGLIIAIRGEDHDWTAFLLNKGADPNAPGAGGDTPLIAAARANFGDAVGWLLGQGAKVDGTNKSGETALIVAVQLRQARMVKDLLDAGANPDRTDAAAGYSARDYAQRDPRARDILKLIEAKKPKSSANAAN